VPMLALAQVHRAGVRRSCSPPTGSLNKRIKCLSTSRPIKLCTTPPISTVPMLALAQVHRAGVRRSCSPPTGRRAPRSMERSSNKNNLMNTRRIRKQIAAPVSRWGTRFNSYLYLTSKAKASDPCQRSRHSAKGLAKDWRAPLRISAWPRACQLLKRES